MKKLLLLVVACTALVGCGLRTSDLETLSLKGKVESIEQRFIIESDNYYDRIYLAGIDISSDTNLEFNEDGFIDEKEYYFIEEKTGTLKLKLDKNGYVLETKYRPSDRDSDYEHNIEFDSEEGLAILDNNEQVGGGESGFPGDFIDFDVSIVYDDEGREIERTTEYDDDEGYVTEYVYEDGMLIEITQNFDGNKVEMIFEYEDGIMVGYEYESDDDSYEVEFSYEDYDDEGNWTELEVEIEGEVIGTFERDIDYY